MKLIDAHIDGFGVWSDLSLADLSPQCTVFYGPNEAGKTTLLEFLRAVLYGFSPARTARYLPPVQGTAAGGSLTVGTPDEGRLHICRREHVQLPLGSVTVEAADGTVQGDAQLNRLLHDVDEAMFQNVFAVGLQEVQELGTLSNSDAARWLYGITAGMDRVSLCDVLTELTNSRRRLWSDQPYSQIGQLLSARNHLQSEVADLASLSRQLEQLTADRTAAEQQIAELETILAEQEAACRKWETAVALCDPWQRRHDLNVRIEAIGPTAQWPPNAVERMNRLRAHIRQARRTKRRAAIRRKKLSDSLRSLKLNPVILRHSARIEALLENESWIVALEQEIRQGEETVKKLTADRQLHQDRLAAIARASAPPTSPQQSILPVQFDASQWRSLRRPAAALLQAKRLANDEQQKVGSPSVDQSRRTELDQALAARGQKTLTSALESAGQRVAQLRRRIQLDELIQQLGNTKADLEHAISGYLERQILPPWMVLSLGGIFVLGVVLILGGLLLPGSFTGSLGWPMAWLGLLGVGSAVAAKFTMERSAANQLEASRRQLALVESQTKQADAERRELDQALPKGVGSFATRLQAAQQELARLEELLPVDAQRQSLHQASQDADFRRAQAQRDYEQALENWQTTLADHGLPDHLSPPQVRAMFTGARQLDEANRRLADAQSEVDRRRRELAAFSARIDQAFLAVELLPQSSVAGEQLRQLRRELADQDTLQKQRDLLVQRRHKLRRRRRAAGRQLRRMRMRRARLLRACQVTGLTEFRRRSGEFAQIAALIAQRDAAANEITTLIASYSPRSADASESDVSALVSTTAAEQLAAQLAQSRCRLDETRRRQQRLFEDRGQRNAQIRLLSDDRRLRRKCFELAHIDERLAAAVRRYQVLTITHHWLDLIREYYERYRQPETLREASKYLVELTAGRYRRVWTRWGENTLLVDDADQRTLPVEVLSRGTREQLFLSLRLALVAVFARRGIELPLVLDDVLVNFDAERAAAAVQVLQDFASQGHQLLVFTCHEHIARLFKNRGVDVRRLPSDRRSVRGLPFDLEAPLPPRRMRTRRPKEEIPTPPVVIDVTPPLPQLVDEPPDIIPLLPPEPLRLDPPEQVVRLSPIVRRWAYWTEEVDEPARRASSSDQMLNSASRSESVPPTP